MANEIHVLAGPGQTLVYDVRDGATAVSTGNALTAVASTGVYFGSLPAGIPAGLYAIVVRAGSTVLGIGRIRWDGTAEVLEATVAQGAAILADTGTALPAAIATRLAASAYTAPDNTGIGQINTRLPPDPADASDIAAGFTTLAGIIPTAGAIAAAVWTAGTRTLTTAAYSVADIAEAVWTRTVRVLTGGVPTAADNAAAVRTNLTTELGRLDAAVSTRSTYAGADTAGTATLLGRITGPVLLASAYTAPLSAAGTRAALGLAADNLDAQLSASKTILDKLDTTVQLDGAVYRFTSNALELAPTGTGGGGSGPSAEVVAAAVRLELAPELELIDAPISSRSTYAGTDTPGTELLLERITGTVLLASSYTAPLNAAGMRDALGLAAPNLDEQLAAGLVVLGKVDTTLQADGPVFRFTANALEMAPAGGGGGGGGASLEVLFSSPTTGYPAGSLAAAIDRLHAVPPGPLDPAPAVPTEPSTCRVYGQLQTLDGRPAVDARIEFQLVKPGPAATGRLIYGRVTTVRTGQRGQLIGAAGNWLDLQRNDAAGMEGSYYQVASADLGIKTPQRVDLTTPVADLRALLLG
jgi:hypothetical protein